MDKTIKAIFPCAVQKVARGARFFVDLENKSLSIGGSKIITEGQYNGSLGIEEMTSEDAITEIEDLYQSYKHSVPSERSERKRRRYFKALKEDELSDEDMMHGELRDIAQLRLELFVLCCVLNGSLTWQGNGWFWQSPNDTDLVILKKWIEKQQQFNNT